jgi:hypothetical protein
MAIINVSCPDCSGVEWSEVNLDTFSYHCSACGGWINEEDLNLDIGFLKLNENNKD